MAEVPAEARTEEATPRRIERTRRSGDIAVSRDLIAGLVVASTCVAMVVGGRSWAGGLALYLRTAFAEATVAHDVSASLGKGLRAGFLALWPVLTVAVIVALLAGLAQTRGNLAGERIRADLRRIRPRLGRILGRDNASEVAMDLLKIAALCGVAGWSVHSVVVTLAGLAGAGAAQVLATLWWLAQRLGVHLAIVMVALGIVDYLWQVSRHRNRLRMTREEAKREKRESEGDAEHKAERRRLHHQLQAERTVRDVGLADVLLVEPGGAVVAISYSGWKDEAPVLLLRGQGLRGRRIEDIGRRAGVPIHVESALVRALASVEEEEEVPEALYPSLARIIAMARRQRASVWAGGNITDGRAG